MSTIQPVQNATVRTFDLCNIETWRELAKTVAKIAALAILPVLSHLAFGPFVSGVVLSLEIVGLLALRLLGKVADVAPQVIDVMRPRF